MLIHYKDSAFAWSLKCVAVIFVWENKQKWTSSMFVIEDAGPVPAPRTLAYLPTIPFFQATPTVYEKITVVWKGTNCSSQQDVTLLLRCGELQYFYPLWMFHTSDIVWKRLGQTLRQWAHSLRIRILSFEKKFPRIKTCNMFITLNFGKQWTQSHSHIAPFWLYLFFSVLPNCVPIFIPCILLWSHFASWLDHQL